MASWLETDGHEDEYEIEDAYEDEEYDDEFSCKGCYCPYGIVRPVGE